MTEQSTAQLALDLSAKNDLILGNSWVDSGLGRPGSPVGLLTSTLNPLTGLATAGFGFILPLVSFLGEGLTHLQGGNSASVTSGSQDFGDAGRDLAGVAGSYENLAKTQTTGWNGAAALDYQGAAQRQANGVNGLGQGSTTTGSAIIGAGQVVAQAIAEVTALVAQAVGEIVPILTAAAGKPESLAVAIPTCIGIAAGYAAQIAAKLAALLASGDNLMKLVNGAMGIVDLIKSALSGISQQSVRPDADSTLASAADQQPAASASDVEPPRLGDADSSTPTSGAGSAPASSAGGFGGAPSIPSGPSMPERSALPGAGPLGVASQSTGALPHSTLPAGAPRGGAVSTGAVPGGAVPVGAAGFGMPPGARTGAGRGADTVHQNRTQPPAGPATGGRTQGGAPLGGLGGARAAGEKDKEHQRKYSIVEQHEEDIVVAPEVITSAKPTE